MHLCHVYELIARVYIKLPKAEFTGWVPLIPEDLGNFYPMIEVSGLVSENWDAIRLLEFLSSVAADHAPFVVSLLEKLVHQERGPLFWRLSIVQSEPYWKQP